MAAVSATNILHLPVLRTGYWASLEFWTGVRERNDFYHFFFVNGGTEL